MRIHCDACGAEIDTELALCEELDTGEIYWFCNEECLATAALYEEQEDEPEKATV